MKVPSQVPSLLANALRELRAEHAATLAAHTPPTYAKRARVKHWWETRKGILRNHLRDWLGITELDERVGNGTGGR